MDIHRPQGVTRDIGAPKDWTPEIHGPCASLPVVDHVVEGLPYMRSHWRPSPSDMAALDAGGSIVLDIQGQVHPVIAMGVEPCPPIPMESASRRIAIAIAAAVEAMLETTRQSTPGAYLAVSPCRVDAQGAGIRWGIVKDPAKIGADFAHWSIIGPIGDGYPEDFPQEHPDELPDLPDFLTAPLGGQ